MRKNFSMRWQGPEQKIKRCRPRAKRLELFPKPTAPQQFFHQAIGFFEPGHVVWYLGLGTLFLHFRLHLLFWYQLHYFSYPVTGQCPNPGPGRLSRRPRPRTPLPSVGSQTFGICSVEVNKGNYAFFCEVGKHWVLKACSGWRGGL